MATIDSDKIANIMKQVEDNIRSSFVEQVEGKNNDEHNKKIFEEIIKEEIKKHINLGKVNLKFEWHGNDLKVIPYIGGLNMRKYKKINYYASISEFKGKTLKSYEMNEDKDEIIFNFDDGQSYLMYHSQDCCEYVSIEDIVGDLDNLIGEPLVMAEEVSNVNEKPLCVYEESYTWTYYKLATVNGYVTIRWYGSSNGYYSEGVDIAEIKYI